MNPRGNVYGDLMHYRQAVHLDLAIKLDRGEITKEQAEVQFKAINAQLEAEMLRRQAAQRAQIMQAGAAALANQPRQPIICNTNPGPLWGSTTTCE